MKKAYFGRTKNTQFRHLPWENMNQSKLVYRELTTRHPRPQGYSSNVLHSGAKRIFVRESYITFMFEINDLAHLLPWCKVKKIQELSHGNQAIGIKPW